MKKIKNEKEALQMFCAREGEGLDDREGHQEVYFAWNEGEIITKR